MAIVSKVLNLQVLCLNDWCKELQLLSTEIMRLKWWPRNETVKAMDHVLQYKRQFKTA